MAFGSLHFDGVAYLEGIDVLGEDASTGKFGVCVGAVDFDYEGYGAGCFVSGYGGVTPFCVCICVYMWGLQWERVVIVQKSVRNKDET